MAEGITVLPTSRAIREAMLSRRDNDGFLPRYITTGEFLQRILVAEGRIRIDDDTRVLLLLEAADFSAFSHLKIERNFFTFTKNASYIFRFFEELAGERVGIERLEYADTYGDYEEHIEILRQLHENYRRLCDANNVLDPIFIPELAALNRSYVESLGAIELHAEGYLTNFEFSVLLECASIVPVTLRFTACSYNVKMQRKFAAIGIETPMDMHSVIDLTQRRVISSTPQHSDARIDCESFGERLLQAAFIKQKVYEFIESGIAPERIAVVLPDESFAEHLRRFDAERNFNFAMGTSLGACRSVRVLEAAMAALENPSVQNRSRMERMASSCHGAIAPHYRKDVAGFDFAAFIAALLETEAELPAAAEIVHEELFYFTRILPHLHGSDLKSALHLFVNRLKKRSLDDVRGGKVTVMGVLETRAVRFDGVIVVDFNEGIVPRKSEKDLFLNSATRIRAGLPGAKDREALQKLYYHHLFNGAKRVAIAYVESADAVPTRFLSQLGIAAAKGHDDTQWANILFAPGAPRQRSGGAIEAEYDFTLKPLSATGLKTFLQCRRRFYHRYVEGVREHRIERDLPEEHEIGNALHEALRHVYTATPRYSDIDALRRDVTAALERSTGGTPLDRYLHELWIRRMEPFFANEIERFASAEVAACETALECRVGAMTLTGRIDRIDRTPEGLEVLDYKSGKYATYTARTVEQAVDFQLEFYRLLASEMGTVARCGYYDLKSGAVVDEAVPEAKLERLYAHLEELGTEKRWVFEQTEKLGDCRFCEFVHLCGREL